MVSARMPCVPELDRNATVMQQAVPNRTVASPEPAFAR
ncbi:protein of unknown function [Streptantibioticus cattleyicolor NRRL 8057 = DSM 46488]|nr:protein of unknown function [Streptantibioticus cattleyicolor NRRL 8057 = DSM 46488]